MTTLAPSSMSLTDVPSLPCTPPASVGPSSPARAADQIDIAPPPYLEAQDEPDPMANESAQLQDESVTLTINAPHEIRGDSNVASVMPLVDATRYCTVLLTSIKQLMQRDDTMGHVPRPPLNLVINCGVTVVGDRNFIGTPLPRPQQALPGLRMVNGSLVPGRAGIASQGGVATGRSVQNLPPVVAGAKRPAPSGGEAMQSAPKARRTLERPDPSAESQVVRQGEVKKEEA
nr:hypothetical protein CFP56_68349 [Quercus suber]